MSIIQARHRLAIVFVKATDNSPAAQDNSVLLRRIIASPQFTPELLSEALQNPWRMQNVYKDGQEPVMVYDETAVFNCWTLPNSDSAAGSLTILTTLKTLATGEKAMMPVNVTIPEGLVGAKITADVSGKGNAEYIVQGLGWGTTFSCCGSENALDFHMVIRDADGVMRSQPRPSSLFSGKITQAYNEQGLVQMVGGGPLHTIQHKIHEIKGLGSHCGHKLNMTPTAMASGAKPVEP